MITRLRSLHRRRYTPRTRQTRRRLGLLACAFLSSAGIGCRSGALPKSALTGTWYLTAIDGAPALDATRPSPGGARPTLTLEAPAKLYGFGGVNLFFGSFASGSDEGFRALGVSTTKRAGAPERAELEALFLARLAEAEAFRAFDDVLELAVDGRVVLRFESTPQAAPPGDTVRP